MRQLASTEKKNASPLVLTEDDVNRLLTDTSAETRVDMTNKIGSAYNSEELNDNETIVAEQIFRLLLRDTELRVRVSLAQHVKDSPEIPRDIVMSLVQDVEEVSLPVLQYSEVLSDADLIDLVQSTEQVSRYLAVSRRRKISSVVSDTLIKKGNDQVAASLVENQGAEISEEGYEKIIKEHCTNENLMQRLSNRPYLPVAAVDKMMTVVSAKLAQTLKQKYKVPAEHIDREVEKTQEKESLNLVRLAVAEEDIDKLITQMHAHGRLTPSIILSALCQGNFEFFEMSLARLSSLPVANTRKLINDRGELGFRAIYNKSGLPDTMFPAVKLLLKVVRDLHEDGEKPGSSHYANRIVERILQHSEDANMDNLSYVVALVKKVAQ